MLDLPQKFDFNGQSVAWGVMGDGDPLVLVHGTPFSSQVWRRIAPLLARRWKVYFFDLLGYGQSEKRDQQDVSLGVQNGLLAALIREWGLTEPEVLCHDFGGATTLRGYYINGLRYRKLTLINPVAVKPLGSPFFRHVGKHEEAFAKLPAYAHEALCRAYIQNGAFNPLDDQALDIYATPWRGSQGQPAFYRQIAQFDEKYIVEIEDRYGPMDCPVRLIWGERDDWIPIAQGHKLAEKLTAGALTTVPNSGHLVQEDAPEAIVAAMFE